MVYLLAIIATIALLVNYRLSVLLMPVWALLTPKALLLLDVPSAPVVSLYKYLCVLLFVVHAVRVCLSAEPISRRYPFSIAFMVILIPASISVLANLATPNAGILTLVTLIIEVVFPVTVYCHYFGQVGSQKRNDLMNIYIVAGCTLAIYGTLCYFVKFNPYIDFVQSTNHTGRIIAQTYEESVRGLRAQGTISHPITYGAIIVTILYGYIVYKMRSITFSERDYFKVGGSALIVVLAILFSNSRTPLIFFALPLALFAILIGGLKSAKYVVSLAGLLALGFFTSSVFRDKILSVVNIFNPSVGIAQNGSSISMRQEQLAVSAKYLSLSPIWGGGLDHARNIVQSGSEPGLFNTESIIFRLMIDQGTLGLLSYIIFFVLIYTVVAKTFTYRPPKVMYLGFVISYAIFVISTGTMDTLQHVMLMASFLYYIGKADVRSLQRVKVPRDREKVLNASNAPERNQGLSRIRT